MKFNILIKYFKDHTKGYIKFLVKLYFKLLYLRVRQYFFYSLKFIYDRFNRAQQASSSWSIAPLYNIKQQLAMINEFMQSNPGSRYKSLQRLLNSSGRNDYRYGTLTSYLSLLEYHKYSYKLQKYDIESWTLLSVKEADERCTLDIHMTKQLSFGFF